MIGSDGEGERKEATHPKEGNRTDNKKSIVGVPRERRKKRRKKKKGKERKDSQL